MSDPFDFFDCIHSLLLCIHRRTYVGWLKKNKFVEEWNGRREITEKTWRAKWSNLHMFALYAVGVPGGIYWWTRSEMHNKGDRRYDNVL